MQVGGCHFFGLKELMDKVFKPLHLVAYEFIVPCYLLIWAAGFVGGNMQLCFGVHSVRCSISLPSTAA